MAKLIIFTDLDGTLLHPTTYSFEDAIPALELIKEKNIPLVLCSSKTKKEIEVYRERLENKHPFISENGGGIFMPEGYFHFPVEGKIEDGYKVITIGRPYEEIRKVLSVLREGLNIKVKGFGDMSAEEIAVLAGLPLYEAEFTKARDFDEPFIFAEGEPRITEFLNAIEGAALKWTQGRFYHILGDNDKGKAVSMLKESYKKEYREIATVGLGDSLNDLPFLKEVDYPVIIQREDGSYEKRINLPNLIKSNGVGPKGWNKVITDILKHEDGYTY